MAGYFNLLPSEISGLVIGFLRDSDCIGAAEAFLQECAHLSEFRSHYSSVKEVPVYFRELTLLDIPHDYVNIVNEVVPHLKKINLPCHLGKLADSVAKLLRYFVRQKPSYPTGHPEWMPVGRSFVQPRIESSNPTLSDIQPLTTVNPTTNTATTTLLLDKITTSNCIGHQAQSVSESSQDDEQTAENKSLSITNSPSASSLSVSSIPSVQMPVSSNEHATVNYTDIPPSETNEIMRENYSSQICSLQSSDDVNNLISNDNDNNSIFYVYPHLPRTTSGDGVVKSPELLSQDNIDNQNANSKCVSTKRKRSQPPRHLLSSPSAGNATMSGLVTNCEEDEELDMEQFLAALFENAEEVATRINTEVVVPNRNCDDDDDAIDTTTSAVTAAAASNNNNNNVVWKCVKEDPSNYEGNNDNDKSIETCDTILKNAHHSPNNDACTTQSSDNLQIWNEWFGVKGDLDTCIDRLLSDFESSELTSTSTSTANIPATIPATDITTNITTSTAAAAVAATSTTVVNFENYHDVYMVDIDDPLHESAIKMLKVSRSLISNPCVSQSVSIPMTSSSSSSSSSSSPSSSLICVSPVTVSRTTTTTTTTTALPITLRTRTPCDESHVNSPMTSPSTRLRKRNKNINENDRSITLENNNNNASMTSTSITYSQQTTTTHQPVTITSSGLCSDQLSSKPVKHLRNKRRCVNQTSKNHNNNNNDSGGSRNTFTILSSVLNAPDSNKAYNRNEYEIHNSNNNTTTDNNNERLFSHSASPSCVLSNKNTADTTLTVPTNMPSVQQYQYHHLSNDSSVCYYSTPQNAQALITSQSTSTSMATVFLANNPYPAIDLTRSSDSNNSSNNYTITITNIPTSTTTTIATIATENTTSTEGASTVTTINSRLISAVPSSVVVGGGHDVHYVNTSQNHRKQHSETSEISTDAKENQPPQPVLTIHQSTTHGRKKHKYPKFTIIGR